MDKLLRHALCLAALLLIVACRREPVLLEVEDFSGVSPDSNYGVTASRGWGSYHEPSFSGDRAALTKVAGASATAVAKGLAGHTYRVDIVVLSYAGRGRNVFDLTVGGITKRLHFGGTEGIPGLIRLGDLYFRDVKDDSVSLRAVSVGQDYLVVDRLRLVPYSGEIPDTITEWERPTVDIQGGVCLNCVQAESLTPVSRDPNYGVAAGAGWASYSEPSCSAGRAALTRVQGAVITGQIPNFRPGAYRVTIAAVSQGDQQNSFDIQIGSEAKRITFGGRALPQGIVHLTNLVFDRVDDPTIAVKAVDVRQYYLILDAFSLEPVDQVPAATAHQGWTVAEADPIIERCVNCVEAESLKGVSADPNYGNTAGLGWASYDNPDYSGHRAALTRLLGALANGTVPNFQPGSYRVTATVLNYDPHKTNAFALTLGNQTREIRFGPGLPGTIVRIRNIEFRNVASPSLTLKALRIEQPYLVIDNLSLRYTGPSKK